MNRNEIGRKYDEFFGTGLWERDYKSHIVIFTEQCLINNQYNINDISVPEFKIMRVRLNMSMQDVANKTGVSKATISRLEMGKDVMAKNERKLNEFYSNEL